MSSSYAATMRGDRELLDYIMSDASPQPRCARLLQPLLPIFVWTYYIYNKVTVAW